MSPLDEILDELSGLLDHVRSLGAVQWILNPGNAGDGMIAAGTVALFDAARIDYRITTRTTLIPDMTALYGGGGAWCRAFGIGPEIVRDLAPIAGRVIVLPSTFEAEKLALVADVPNLTLYGRDNHSTMLAVAAGFPVGRCHDLAFGCPMSTEWDYGGHGVLAAFRRDRIGTARLPDLREIGATEYTDPSRDGSHESGDALLKWVARYDVVHTDRTHVAIAGAMTGRETYIYPNGDNYRKNIDLFEMSLQRFPNCRLVN